MDAEFPPDDQQVVFRPSIDVSRHHPKTAWVCSARSSTASRTSTTTSGTTTSQSAKRLSAYPDEPEMQRNLASRLHERANGAYTIVREDEVIDGKKPDIRLATIGTDQKVAIEVKVADKWTVNQLRAALYGQLRSQYLRHSSCRAGCLLLTYRGRKSWWGSSRGSRPPRLRRPSRPCSTTRPRPLPLRIRSPSTWTVLGLDLKTGTGE